MSDNSSNYLSNETNLQYVIKITYIFALIGTFANILFNIMNQETATASMIALGIGGAGAMFAILFTMMYLNITEGGFSTSGIPSPKKIVAFVIKLFPSVLTFVLIALYFTINAMYADRINSHNIAGEFNTYYMLAAILLFIQTSIVGAGLWNIMGKPTGESQNSKINKLLGIVILFIINLYMCGIINVILKFFSTDG
tara:strand:+ start:1276 stop:1866 length:591 start_codon:yes stop_codon:yes gene_type:complete